METLITHGHRAVPISQHPTTAAYFVSVCSEPNVAMFVDALRDLVFALRVAPLDGGSLAPLYATNARAAYVALGGKEELLQHYRRAVPGPRDGAALRDGEAPPALSSVDEDKMSFLDHLVHAARSPAALMSGAALASASVLTVGDFAILRDTSPQPFSMRVAASDLAEFLPEGSSARLTASAGVTEDRGQLTLASTIVLKTIDATGTSTATRAVHMNAATGAVVAVTVGRALLPLDYVVDLIRDALGVAETTFSTPGGGRRAFSHAFDDSDLAQAALLHGFPVVLSFGHLQAFLLHLDSFDACMGVDDQHEALAGQLGGSLHAQWPSLVAQLRGFGTPVAHGAIFNATNDDGSSFTATEIFVDQLRTSDLTEHDLSVLGRVPAAVTVASTREGQMRLDEVRTFVTRARSPRCRLLASRATNVRSPCCVECQRLLHAKRNTARVRLPLSVPRVAASTSTAAAWTSSAGRVSVFVRPVHRDSALRSASTSRSETPARAPSMSSTSSASASSSSSSPATGTISPSASSSSSSSSAYSRRPLMSFTHRELADVVRNLRGEVASLRDRVTRETVERERLDRDAATPLELTLEDEEDLDELLASEHDADARAKAERDLPPEAIALWESHKAKLRLERISTRKGRVNAAKGNRWSKVMLQLALFWHSISPRLYTEMGSYVGLPSQRSLRRCTRAYTLKTGVHVARFALFAQQMHAYGLEPKLCVAMVAADEVAIKQGLRWSAATGDLLGYADAVTGSELAASISQSFSAAAATRVAPGKGGAAPFRASSAAAAPPTPRSAAPGGHKKRGAAPASPLRAGAADGDVAENANVSPDTVVAPAKAVLQFIGTSLFSPTSMPLAKVAVTSLRSGDFIFWLSEILCAAQQVGITIAAMSTDGAGPFRKSQRLLLQTSSNLVPEDFADEPVALLNAFAGGLPVYWLPDFLHKMENLTGAILRTGRNRLSFHGVPVSMRPLRDVYDTLQAAGKLAIAPVKLSEKVLYPTAYDRMNPANSLAILRAYSSAGMVPATSATEGAIAFAGTVLKWYNSVTSPDRVTTVNLGHSSAAPLRTALESVTQLRKWSRGADGAKNMPDVVREVVLGTVGAYGVVSTYVVPLRYNTQPGRQVAAPAAASSSSSTARAGPASSSSGGGGGGGGGGGASPSGDAPARDIYLVPRRLGTQSVELLFCRIRARTAGSNPTLAQYAATESHLAAAGAGDAHGPRLTGASNAAYSLGRFQASGFVARVRDGERRIQLGDTVLPLDGASAADAAAVVSRRVASLAADAASPERPTMTRKMRRGAAEAATASLTLLADAEPEDANKAKFRVLRALRRAFLSVATSSADECPYGDEIRARTRGNLRFPSGPFSHVVNIIACCAMRLVSPTKLSSTGRAVHVDKVKAAIVGSSKVSNTYLAVLNVAAVRSATGVRGAYLQGLFARLVDWVVNLIVSGNVRAAEDVMVTTSERMQAKAAHRQQVAGKVSGSAKAAARALSQAAAAAAGGDDVSVIASVLTDSDSNVDGFRDESDADVSDESGSDDESRTADSDEDSNASDASDVALLSAAGGAGGGASGGGGAAARGRTATRTGGYGGGGQEGRRPAGEPEAHHGRSRGRAVREEGREDAVRDGGAAAGVGDIGGRPRSRSAARRSIKF